MSSVRLDTIINGIVSGTKDEFGNPAYQHPVVLRPNVIIQCGDDGSSQNNCVLSGGNYGILADGSIFGFEVLDDVVIEG